MFTKISDYIQAYVLGWAIVWQTFLEWWDLVSYPYIQPDYDDTIFLLRGWFYEGLNFSF